MSVSLDKPAEWSEASGYRTRELWAYLTTVFDSRSAREVYTDLTNNDLRGMAQLLTLHFHYDNVTGMVASRER